ncbi:MAG: Fe-Mn family superoxide dismutase [Bacilli bacterium]|nr:Fe-Mn family superoxide dismutase [Bacilli bacterium]
MYKKITLETNYLEPYLSKITIENHYNLYLNYLNNLNTVLIDNNFEFNIPKEEIYLIIDKFDIKQRDKILYNLGGTVNHELYFKSFNAKTNTNEFNEMINKQFKNIDEFKNKFIKEANNLVGSGYTFLVINKEKQLEIVNFVNQESPYLYDLIPILALDLWEHSYYLDYYSKRNEYIKSMIEIIDFNQVNINYEKNIK